VSKHPYKALGQKEQWFVLIPSMIDVGLTLMPLMRLLLSRFELDMVLYTIIMSRI